MGVSIHTRQCCRIRLSFGGHDGLRRLPSAGQRCLDRAHISARIQRFARKEYGATIRFSQRQLRFPCFGSGIGIGAACERIIEDYRQRPSSLRSYPKASLREPLGLDELRAPPGATYAQLSAIVFHRSLPAPARQLKHRKPRPTLRLMCQYPRSYHVAARHKAYHGR